MLLEPRKVTASDMVSVDERIFALFVQINTCIGMAGENAEGGDLEIKC